MSYTKFCNKCGQRISLREMQGGQWVAFNVNTDKVHKHSRKKVQAKNSSNFKYTKEIINNKFASLEFKLTIDDTEINGIDLISWNEEGLITEFKVFIRPLQGVNLIHKLMQKMLDNIK